MFVLPLFLLYLAAGAAVALAFAAFGASRLLPGTRVSLGARVLLIPGAFLLWPLVLLRWIVHARGAGR